MRLSILTMIMVTSALFSFDDIWLENRMLTAIVNEVLKKKALTIIKALSLVEIF